MASRFEYGNLGWSDGTVRRRSGFIESKATGRQLRGGLNTYRKKNRGFDASVSWNGKGTADRRVISANFGGKQGSYVRHQRYRYFPEHGEYLHAGKSSTFRFGEHKKAMAIAAAGGGVAIGAAYMARRHRANARNKRKGQTISGVASGRPLTAKQIQQRRNAARSRRRK